MSVSQQLVVTDVLVSSFPQQGPKVRLLSLLFFFCTFGYIRSKQILLSGGRVVQHVEKGLGPGLALHVEKWRLSHA